MYEQAWELLLTMPRPLALGQWYWASLRTSATGPM